MTTQPVHGERWQRRFFTIWIGQAFSILGSNLVQFALVWWLTAETGSATVLATASLFAMLPMIFLSPFAGALVDRWNRRTVMIVADTFIAVLTGFLALLFITESVQVWHVYLIMMLRSAAGSFHGPAMQASTSLMVPEQHLGRISGINQMLGGAVNIVAPPLGALMIALLPIHGVLLIDVVTALIAVVPLLFLSVPQPKARPVDAPRTSFVRDMVAGLRYVREWRGALSMISIATLLNLLLSPAFSMMPLMVKLEFNGAQGELALIESLFGVGVIIGGILLGVWGGFKRQIVTVMFGLIGIGVGTLLIAFAPPTLFIMAVIGMFIGGLSQVFANGPLMAIMQARVTPEMQGRVFTLTGSLSMAASPIGLLIAGPVADTFGVRLWFLVAGAACLIMAVYGFANKAVMQVGDKPEGDEQKGTDTESAAVPANTVVA
jgi:MFS transporter, DHA3 family, macrolide efflux protein